MEEQPDKPRIEDMPPEDGIEPPTEQEEQDAPENFLDSDEAAADDTIDDQEQIDQP